MDIKRFKEDLIIEFSYTDNLYFLKNKCYNHYFEIKEEEYYKFYINPDNDLFDSFYIAEESGKDIYSINEKGLLIPWNDYCSNDILNILNNYLNKNVFKEFILKEKLEKRFPKKNNNEKKVKI